MTTLPGNSDSEKLSHLSEKTYKEQCIWFLNAFWPQVPFPANGFLFLITVFPQFGGEAEKIWVYKVCLPLSLVACLSTSI